MATGANERYWEERNLPTVFKHEFLRRYVPHFTGMTGSSSADKRVVFLDGYAGRGRYDDGSPGSAELIMQMAERQGSTTGPSWTCFFVERDPKSSEQLTSVVGQYVGRGLDARSHSGDVVSVLGDVLTVAQQRPLFPFLDPTGYGLSFSNLVNLLAETRRARRPPTEVLLNFSLDAVRRTAGHLRSPHGNESTMQRLDNAVGGDWWRAHFQSAESHEAATERVVEGFCSRLGAATGMHVVSVPVRRAPHHQPLYHLVFGTRSQHGLWIFGDTVPRVAEAWWDTLDEVEAETDPSTLFSVTSLVRPKLDAVEMEAEPVIAHNIARLLDDRPQYKVVEHTLAVFGEFYGRVRETTVRRAVKRLHDAGRTGCTGVGLKPRDLVITRPRA